MPRISSSEKWDNLDKYDKFVNELSVRIECGWTPADHVPYDEDLLRHTLGLSPRVKSSDEFYPDSDQVHKRSRFIQESISDRRTESDKKSISASTRKRDLQSTDQRRGKK